MTATLAADQVTQPSLPRDSASRNTQVNNPFASPGSVLVGQLLEGAQAALVQRMFGSASADTVQLWGWVQTETRTAPALLTASWVSLAELAVGAAILRLSAIPQVASMFFDVVQEAPIFTVFVKGDHYDDAVMDKLLDAELALHKQLKGFRMTFNYLPHVAGRNLRQMVRETARCIFERAHG